MQLFVWLKQSKEPLVVDLAAPEGEAALRDLVQTDAPIQNLKLGALARLGWGSE